ncbi:HEPN domain-containing protein [uncultured Eudoraea sp.]|uniref:HEPN domain-containing protein n=1 Tax=uncultured Eudoraea sp. TaxID=1035614 RepID=UPI00262722ED|nr:HEPN domain-containing protein [uncultured Eudoraea sp.]
MENRAQKLYETAIQKLKEANDELCRPAEDVVSFMVCQNSHIAIDNYLKGFLIENNIEPEANATVDALYEKCKAVNGNFEKVNLSGFECEEHQLDSRFCSGVTNVSRCYDIADSLDTFLREEKIIK